MKLKIRVPMVGTLHFMLHVSRQMAVDFTNSNPPP